MQFDYNDLKLNTQNLGELLETNIDSQWTFENCLNRILKKT